MRRVRAEAGRRGRGYELKTIRVWRYGLDLEVHSGRSDVPMSVINRSPSSSGCASALDGQPGRGAPRSGGFGQDLAVTNRPLGDMNGFVRILPLDNRDNVVGVDDERVPIRQYGCRRGIGPACASRTRPRRGSAWRPGSGGALSRGGRSRAHRAGRSGSEGALVAIDPDVRIGITAPLFVTFDQASIREKSSLNRPSQTSLCVPPLRT